MELVHEFDLPDVLLRELKLMVVRNHLQSNKSDGGGNLLVRKSMRAHFINLEEVDLIGLL